MKIEKNNEIIDALIVLSHKMLNGPIAVATIFNIDKHMLSSEQEYNLEVIYAQIETLLKENDEIRNNS